MRWQNLVDDKPARTVRGDGFEVRLYNPANLRYSEAGRTLTLLTEVVDESEIHGRKWLVLPNVRVLVYVPSVLKWDDDTPITQVAASVVLDRIGNALKSAGERYRINVRDEVYEQAERDWHDFGPKN